MLKFLPTIVLIFCCIAIGKVQAKDVDYVSKGEWNVSLALGYGNIENPIGGIDDLNFYLLPSVSYYNDRFFIENTTIGYALYEEGPLIIDLVGKLNDDGLYFNFEDFGVLTAVGLDSGRGFGFFDIEDVDRDLSYLAGFAANYDFSWFYLSTRFYQDITGTHQGHEFDVSVSKLFTFDKWAFIVEAVSNQKSKDLLAYYYQIEQHESIIFVGLYEPTSNGTNYHVHVSADYMLNQDWSLSATYKKTWLSKQITRSPIITQETMELFFVGVKYSF